MIKIKAAVKKRNGYTLAEGKDFVQKLQQSGMKVTDFCSLHDVSYSSMNRWRRNEANNSWGEFEDNATKRRRCQFPAVDRSLAEYIDFRNSRTSIDKVGLSLEVLKTKAHDIFEAQNNDPSVSFNASNGWFHRFLRRQKYCSKRLNGEAGDISSEDVGAATSEFRTKLTAMMEKEDIPVERLFNADQTGLYYRKMPDRTYCHESVRKELRGCKQMKDKSRITLMVCTSAAGKKLPLAIVGTSVTY